MAPRPVAVQEGGVERPARTVMGPPVLRVRRNARRHPGPPARPGAAVDRTDPVGPIVEVEAAVEVEVVVANRTPGA